MRITDFPSLFLVLLGLSSAHGEDSFKLDGLRVTHVGELAPPAMRVDLVIVGDGYVAEDFRSRGKWPIDSARLVKNFFEKIPFKQYRHLFNVHLVEVHSLDRGADDRPDQDVKRTAFNASYGALGIDRLLVCNNESAVLRAARNAPEADIVLVLVNDSRSGGSGGEIDGVPAPVCSTESTAYMTAIHELGHSFGGLGDEYVDPSVADEYPLPESGDFTQPNLTLAKFVNTTSRERLLETLKWGHFLEDPKAARRHGKGYFEGGYYRESGIYRPARNCMMADQYGSGRFCYVCEHAMTRAICRTSGRSSSGGIFPVPAPRLRGRLRRAGICYEAGRFGEAIQTIETLERRDNLPESDRDKLASLRDAIKKSLELGIAGIEDLREKGQALTLAEHLNLLGVSSKGTEYYAKIRADQKAITSDNDFKKEKRADSEYYGLLRLVHAQAPKTVLDKKGAAFLKKHRGTKSAERAEKP